MKKDTIGCPITLGEYERLKINKGVLLLLNKEQRNWLNYFFRNTSYNLQNCVLKVEDNILQVIINTENSVREFESVEGARKWI